MVLEDSHGNYGISQFREFCGSPGKTSLSTRAATESATPKKPPAKTSSDSVIGLVATSLVDLSSSSPIPNLFSTSKRSYDRCVRERMGSNGVDNRMVKGSRTNQQKEWHINVKELIAVQMSLDSNLDYLQNKVVLI
uniref:Uncharacterized protein n=1 Tax=Cacopsylla melanoneura TaxID=428564 RepID=A0A8D8QAN8_9HEMI